MAALSKVEYLKRYLSDDKKITNTKKKRKPKQESSENRFRILDDDVDFKSLLPSNLHNTLDEDIGDNDPTIAGMIDERPQLVQELERYRQNDRWKSLPGIPDISTNNNRERKQRHDSDSDQSPVRTQRHDSDSDQSPVRTQRHDSDSDQSPARQQSQFSQSNKNRDKNILKGRTRHDSDSDQSPIRKQRHDSDFDQSPVRKQKHPSDSDQSPVRKQNHLSDSDQSPVRKQRHDSDSDQSPVRKQNHHSDSDQSPVRKQKHHSDSDQSPVRNQKHHSDSDQSPPRKRSKNSPESPDHRKKSKHKLESKDRTKKSRFTDLKLKDNQSNDDKGRASHTLGGATAGLSSAQEMKMEAAKLRKKQDQAFNKISADLLGKDARTVVRDKSGRRRDLVAEQEEQNKVDAKKAELDAKYNQWGKGLKQIEAASSRASDAVHEASKPLARYRDDDDLDKMMRDLKRDGDPMMAFMKEKPKSDGKEKPKYNGNAAPNRFGIRPGYRWDGVDRSTGFEKKLFMVQSDRKALSSEAYKWSIEDM